MNNYIKFISMRAGNFSIALVMTLCILFHCYGTGRRRPVLLERIDGNKCHPGNSKFNGRKCKSFGSFA